MILKPWEELPDFMRTPEVKPYYDILTHKKWELLLKRAFDFSVSLILFILLAVPMVIIGILIKMDSKGPILFKQERITTYGKHFYIHKFRTMVNGAEKKGSAITKNCDTRVTRIGAKLRHFRVDEFPQVLDVLCGNMSFVGTRPEVVKFVEQYRPEYYATLLMPAGITSEASIQ